MKERVNPFLLPIVRRLSGAGLFLIPFLAGTARSAPLPDIVFADFESVTYGLWKPEGNAFGEGPSPGTLPQQMEVTDFRGNRLVNSYAGGDGATGRLVSSEFVITRRFIAFLIGGGGFVSRTCVNLVVDGKPVRTASGPNTSPGGSERLLASGWDVGDLAGKTAHFEIIDAATGGWGHITLDQILFTDTKPPLAPALRVNASRTLSAKKRWLNFPVRNGAAKRTITLSTEGRTVHRFDIALADAEPDWWAPLDVSAWQIKALTITVDQLSDDSKALAGVANTEKIKGSETLYRETLRPQFHFSAQRGWLNDPNGLVYYNGEYHLFFQHSPFSWSDSIKYWGQAVSRDLVHWTEAGEALEPDEQGAMWSGSAVIDWANTSGFGTNGKPPLVLIYTAAGNPFVQCIAYSTDGRHFTKYMGNPVVRNISPGNRDPKVFWYEPMKRWVQVLYIEQENGHAIQFLTSPNLRDWTPLSITPGMANTAFLYECPDFFPLPLDGAAEKAKWILMGANSEYSIGSFDGTTFVPETAPLTGHRGRGFYAPQTFSDEPQKRRIQIGWWQTETRGMPFNQSMSLPLELKLISTTDGPRLTWTPIKELEQLRAKSHVLSPVRIGGIKTTDPLALIEGELFEIRAEFAPGDADEVSFVVRGVPVVYNAKKQEIIVNGHRASAPLRDGRQRLTLYADRTGLEVFAADNLTFVPMPVNLNPLDRSLSLSAKGGSVNFTRLDVYELRSAWK